MPTKRSLLHNPIALVAYLLFGGLCLAGWLWFSQVSDRVLNSLNQQTGHFFTDKMVSFDPWLRRLSVDDFEFNEKGVQLGAEQLSFVLNYRHWWEPWLGEKIRSLSAIELINAAIFMESELPALTLPVWFQALSIKEGTLFIPGMLKPLPFGQLTVVNSRGNTLGLTVSSDSKIADDNWHFAGSYDLSSGTLTGELDLFELPFASLVSILPLEHALLEDKTQLNEGNLSGAVTASVSLTWNKHSGLSLKGSAESQQGTFVLSGVSAAWEQWQLHNFQLNTGDAGSSSTGLSVSGLDVKLGAQPIESLNHVITQLSSVLPLPINTFSVRDSRLEFEAGSSQWLFDNLNGQLTADNADNKKARRIWKYQVTALLASVGQFQLDGSITGTAESAENNYTIHLKDAYLAGPLKGYSVYGGYNLLGTEFNLDYNSQSHRGQVDILDWKYRKLRNAPSSSASVDLLRALLTNRSGKSVIGFSLKPDNSGASLPARISQAVEQRFTVIARSPFEYLYRATGQALKPILRHEAGKPSLTGLSYTNLQHLHKVLAQRPELKVLVDVNVSEFRDGPELSRHELEKALLELYSATGLAAPPEAVTIPPKVRATLLEQMYLATRRHQKIPEVDAQSPEQRVQQAEKWLLENWPKAPDQIEKLQQARYDYLKTEIGRIGIDSGRIELKLSSGPERKGREPDSVLTFRQAFSENKL